MCAIMALTLKLLSTTIRPLRYERVYLPLGKVADTPFQYPRGGISHFDSILLTGEITVIHCYWERNMYFKINICKCMISN